MQQQPYGNYPYWNQPMYPQTPYMGASAVPAGPSNGYPPFYGPPNPQPPAPAPQNPNPPAPSPYSFDAAAYAVRPNAHGAAPTRRHRRNHTIPARTPAPTPAINNAAPLKSAMKKTMTAFNMAENTIAKQFTNPFNAHAQAQNQTHTPAMPRPRAHSNPSKPQNLREDLLDKDNPFHVMVSFHGYNELHLENMLMLALEEVRTTIWPMWPDGIESDDIVDHTCIVKFRNMPWDLSGPNVRHAYQLIAGFFQLFQTRGYTYQTAINIATTTPRLIFQITAPDPHAEFFIAYLSQEGRRLTLINPPNHVDISIGARLRSAFPRKILSDNVVEEYTRVIEIRRRPNSNAPEVDPTIFFLEVLKILNNLNFQLDATIPLSRRGPFGIRYSRELLIFKTSVRSREA